MIKNQYHSSLILKRNVDSKGNLTAIDILDIKQVMDNHSCIVLTQLPSESHRVQIEGYTEVFYEEHIGVKNFKVDYVNGVVYFNPMNIGVKMSISYKGIGCELIYSSRIATRLDSNGGVVETLEEIIDKGRDYLEAIESLGGAVTTVQQLENKIAEGKSTKTALDTSIANAQEDIAKIEATGNKEIVIAATDWTLNGDIYEKQITHNLNSENLHVTARNSSTKEAITIGYKIIDKNNILVKSDESINMSCILSASYYHATQTIDDEIATEVVQGRGTYSSIGARFNKIEEMLGIRPVYESFNGTSIN